MTSGAHKHGELMLRHKKQRRISKELYAFILKILTLVVTDLSASAEK